MKSFFYLLVVAVIGVGVGIGVAKLRVGDSSFVPVAPESRKSAGSQERGVAPGVSIDADAFSFGAAIETAEGSHDFVLTNTGTAPLKLSIEEIPNQLLTSKLEKEEVAPGESAKVTVAWKCSDSSQPFTQTATVVTNIAGQRELTLTVTGTILGALKLDPPVMLFRNISPNEATTEKTNLLCYRDAPLTLSEPTKSEAAIAEYFDVVFEPMSADAVKAVNGLAKSGQTVRVTVKPGMAPGPFAQGISVKTNIDSAPKALIPILGTVASDITVAGSGVDSDTNTFHLGVVSGKNGGRARLNLLVKGPHAKNVAFKLASTTPGSLKVTVGEPVELNHGAVVQTPLQIEVPPGTPAANYLGSESGPTSEIVLDTTHPKIPKLRIVVRFAVEN